MKGEGPMLFIKQIKKSLKKQRKKTILMILQLFIAFAVISISLGIYSFYHQAEYDLNKLISSTNSVARLSVYNTDNFNKLKVDQQRENYKELILDVKKNKNVLAVGSSILTSDVSRDEGKHGTSSQPISIVIDKDMIKIINIKIVKGRTINTEDFAVKNNLIPVLLCGQLADKYKINTILDRRIIFPDDHYNKDNSKKFIVVGIISSNFKYWTSDENFMSSIVNGAIIPV